MPNRVIKESIKRSDQIDSLTWFEEVVFYRLIVTADDYGCVDGRPVLLKNELFPTREDVTKKSIENAIAKLVSVGLLESYTVSGMPYLSFPTWEKHQRIRNKHRKYPEKERADTCQSNDRQMTAIRQSESESNPNQNPNPNPNVCTEPEAVSVLTLLLNGGKEYPITEEDVADYSRTYPAVDVLQEFMEMRRWCKDNPTKRKTENGIRRFINSWLEREQNKPHIDKQKPTMTFADLWREENA